MWVVATKIFFDDSSLFREDEPNLTSIFFQMGWFNCQPESYGELKTSHFFGLFIGRFLAFLGLVVI